MMTPEVEYSPRELGNLIEDIRFAMFTTRSSDGALHSRPMTTQKADTDDPFAHERLWFFMSRASKTVIELTADPRVNLAYVDTSKDIYISVYGSGRLVEDPEIKKALWSKMNEAWFPRGPEDPDLALVGVEVKDAEYWNVTDSKLVQVAKMAKAALTGERPAMGEHGHIKPG
ncbi:MAG: pyridoxamine 5'-phosphate oxidase family protein [Nitrosospira sp.]